LHHEGVTVAGVSQKTAEDRVAGWLDRWRHRILMDYAQQGKAGYEELDKRRRQGMNSVNPKVLSSHILSFCASRPFYVLNSHCLELAFFCRS
jgi:hypothetical protein